MAKVTPIQSTAQPGNWTTMPLIELAKSAGIGAVTGLVTIALFYMIERYVAGAVLCHGSADSTCASRDVASSAVAMILGGFAGLFALVQNRTFRPLLVVLMATVALWNLPVLLSGLSWWLAALGAVIAFGLGYAAMTWLSQLRNLFVSFGLVIVLTIIIRILLGIE